MQIKSMQMKYITSTLRLALRAITLGATVFGAASSFVATAYAAEHAANPAVGQSVAHSVATEKADSSEVDRWLGRMNDAFAELDYDGVFSYWSGGNMSSLRVVHVTKDGVEHERLVHLNGAPREIVREGEKVLCILQPGDKLVAMGGSIPAGPFARAFIRDFSDVSSHYDLSMRGSGRIAGRSAVRLSVKARDEHRYGYRLWLDKETGLLLKSELMDEGHNTALEVFQFSQVVIGSKVDHAALEPEQPNGSVIDHLQVADESDSASHPDVKWHADWLPEGFEMASSDMRHAPATKQDVSTLMYSDGLAAISVFVEDMPNAAATNMMTRTGATVSVTRLVHGPDKKRHLVTVIGEVPPKTAAAIATKVSYSK